MKYLFRIFSVLLVCITLSELVNAQVSAFTYQGKLSDAGTAVTGQFDFTFRLFTATSGGSQVGTDLTRRGGGEGPYVSRF